MKPVLTLAFKEWAERLKQPFPDRLARLRHIASGPDDRQDVEAARRLLLKPRYAKRDLFTWRG